MGVAIIWFIVGIISYKLLKDPTRPTFKEIIKDTFMFKGITAPLFVILYIVTVIVAMLSAPFMLIQEWIDSWRE